MCHQDILVSFVKHPFWGQLNLNYAACAWSYCLQSAISWLALKLPSKKSTSSAKSLKWQKSQHYKHDWTSKLIPFTQFENFFLFFSYLHITSEGFICILEAMPVLSTESKCHPRQAEGTVFGYLCINCLRPGWVRHREVLIQELLGDDILQARQESDDQRLTGMHSEKVSNNPGWCK